MVDVTNFSPKASFMGSRENLHVVERWRRVDANTLQYQATVEMLNAQFRLGFLRLEQGDAEGSAECFEACLAARPAWREAEVNLALAYSNIGKSSEAREVLDKVLERDPSYADALRGSAAQSLYSDPALALTRLKQLCESGEKSPEVVFNAGVLHQQSGDWQHAADCYREALALNPKLAGAWVNLGHALLSLGDEKAAHQAWASALELDGKLARGYFS